LAFGAFIVLSRITPSETIAKIFPLFYIIPTSLVAALDAVARAFPQFAYPLASIYSGVGSLFSPVGPEKAAEFGQDRITGFKDLGFVGVLALCARYNPITLMSPLYPMRLALFLGSLAVIFLSGFRAVFLAAIVFFLLAALLGRVKDLFVAAGLGLMGLILLISLQGNVIQLPLTMQRALSWLPGDWNQEAVEDAEGSSRWRFEMVEWAWNDDTILRNKVWGQGIGFSLDDMNLIASMLTSRQAGVNLLGGSDREQFMVTGTFHNGPISAVKCVGVIGLFLYTLLLIYSAVRAWKLCLLSAKTPAFPLALFVGMPAVYFPFQFLVVTGFFELDLTTSIYYAGLLNMTMNYLKSLDQRKFAGQEKVVGFRPAQTDVPASRMDRLRSHG